MNTNLKSQLANYGKHHRDEQLSIEPSDILPNDGAIRTLSSAGHPVSGSVRNRRGVLVTFAVAAVVLSLVAGFTYFLRATDGASAPAESPTTTTSPTDALAIQQVEALLAAVNVYDFDAYAQIAPAGSVVAEGRGVQGWCGDPWCDKTDRPDEPTALANVKNALVTLAALGARWSAEGCTTEPAVESVGGTAVTCTVTYQSLDREAFFEQPLRERMLFRTSRFGQSLVFTSFKVTAYLQFGAAFTRWATLEHDRVAQDATSLEISDPCQLLPREGGNRQVIPSPECATWAIGEVDAATTAVSTRRAFELSLRAAAMCQSPTPYTIGDVNPYEVSVVPVDAIPPGDGFWWSIVPDVAATSEWLTFYDSRRPFEADLSTAISSYTVSRFDPEVRHEAWREFQGRFAAAIAARVLLVDTLRDTSQDRDQVWFDTLANLMRDAQSRCRDVSDSSDEFFPDR